MITHEPNPTPSPDLDPDEDELDALEERRGSWLLPLLIALILCAVLGLAIFYGIHSRTAAEATLAQATQQSAIPLVSVVYPTSGAASKEIELPGNTQPFVDTPIYARTSGYLKRWYADIGTPVKAGQLLAEIETPELDQQLQQAQADLKNAQANLQISQEIAGRYATLLKGNSVSKQETDQAASDLSSKQALVDSGEANIRRLEDLQSFEKVYAPFNGVITARNTDIGSLIQSGSSSGPHELFHLSAIDKLRVYIAVPEVYTAAMKQGEKVTLTSDAYPGETFTGTLTRTSDEIDPQTRTLNVEVDVDNPTGRLLPGAYVFVHFQLPGSAQAVTIPTNTLLFRSEGLRVGVVRDGHVKLTPITIGHDYGDSVEVTSGLTPQDAVILDPSDSLLDGEAVQIANPARK